MNGFSGPERLSVFLVSFVFAVVVGGVLPSPRALAQTLESRVETLEAHDEVLRSRQEVLTSDVNTFKAEVAGATTAIRAEMATEVAAVRAEMAAEDAAVSAIAVPVGGVIAWYGDINSIPENFELCDGNPPTTPGAVFSGNKPNLLQRFVRGAVSSVGATGGRDLIPDATTWPHTLTVEQMPSHNHANGSYKYLLRISGANTIKYADNSSTEPDVKVTAQIQSSGGSQPHSHGISGHDNRPRYYELFYIIRVK